MSNARGRHDQPDAQPLQPRPRNGSGSRSRRAIRSIARRSACRRCRPISSRPRPGRGCHPQPAFAPDASSTRVRTQSLTAISQLQKDPKAMAARALPGLIFGADHPYAALRGGDAAAIGAVSRDSWSAYRTAGSVPTMSRLRRLRPADGRNYCPCSNAQFGRGPRRRGQGRQGVRRDPARPASPRIVLDRPARIAPVDDPRRANDPDRPERRHHRGERRQRRARRQLPSRGSTWTCAKPRAGPMASTAMSRSANRRALHRQRAGSGRPHRRRDRRA